MQQLLNDYHSFFKSKNKQKSLPIKLNKNQLKIDLQNIQQQYANNVKKRGGFVKETQI